MWASSNPSQAFSYLNPKLKAQSGEESALAVEAYAYGATNLCDGRTQVDGTTARIDDQILTANLNGNATTSSYRVVYVTRATTMLDAACGLVAGDTEIWGLDVNPGDQSYYPISSNHDPSLTTDNKQKQGNCKV